MPSTPTADDARARTESARNWRTLMSFLHPYRWRIVAGAVLGIIATVAGLWTPRIIENVIEHLSAGTSVAPDVMLFGALTLVYLVAMLLQWATLGRTAETVVYDVRKALVARFLRGRVTQVRERSTADLIARTTADAPLLQLTVGTGFVSFVTSITGVVGSIVLMGVIDGLMLGITLAAVAVLGLIMGLIMPKVGRERALAQEAVGRMSSELDGSMRALRTIKALRAEDARSEAVLADAEKARKHGVSAMWAELISYETAFGGMQLITVFMVAFGAWRVTEGHLSIAALVAFIMYTQNFIVPLMELADGFSTIQSGLAASKRIAEAQEIELEEPGLAVEPGLVIEPGLAVEPVETPLDADAPVIEFEDVTARYTPAEGDVVRNLDLAIPRRGHVAIVGPSGAGKSSVASLALRFLSPHSGTVRLDGVPYEQLTYAQVRERFAYVEQEPPVLPGTVRDNLLPAKPAADDAELHEVLRAVELAEDVAALPDGLDTELVGATMTGGGRQRLAMARALLAEADVLLLDDATSQIGGRAEEAINRATRAAAENAAVVTIANRLSTVVGADKIVVMDNGRVRATGTHAELLETDDLYAGLVATPHVEAAA
ncbi:ABC transporter ATP-binding protein [Xylanimonas sp. McL0601]|uniref:ABC transporter ATP-binding protein n=1 Tax=Xylanimonas sp. McL0601 TaxID=3414739 RepID=UPI003CEDA227